jgi:histidinol-phosphate aminotransferase
MTKFDALVPAYLDTLPSYKPGKAVRQAELESGVSCIKMASNENPFGPSPLAIEAIRRSAADIHVYPDNDLIELRGALAEINDLQTEQVMVTSGSTSFLDLIARTVLAPGLNAITSKHSFIVYPVVTRAAGARLIELLTVNHHFDLDAIAEAVNSETRLVYLANPNNPTGTLLEAAAIDRFLDRLPEHVITVLDEAYYDYASYFAVQRGVEYSHALDYVREGRRVVVLRTFSKAHGLAGLRVGYGFGPAELMGYFNRLKPPFMVSALGEAAALAALADTEHLAKSVRSNAAEAERLHRELSALGISVVPTWANFLFCEIGDECAAMCQQLQDSGVIVRHMAGDWNAHHAFRVTVGTPEQNDHFLRAIKKVLARVPA